MLERAQIEEYRSLFPVVENWTYLYNGGIHPPPRPVAEAMRAFLRDWEAGGRDAWPRAYRAFEELKASFAELIHSRPQHIVITDSTTAGINLAAQIMRPRPGQNVIVTDLTFMSNAYTWMVAHPEIELRFAPSEGGRVAYDSLERLVDDGTAALNICAVTVGSGFRFDLREIHRLAQTHGTPTLIDASQALGVVDIDVQRLDIDFLACTASKWLMGPTGVGFLYVGARYLNARPPIAGWLGAQNRRDWDVHHVELYNDARRFQGGIPNLVGAVGALAGLQLVREIGREVIEARVLELTGYALDGLERLGADIWTPRGAAHRAGLVFFFDPDSEGLYERLKAERIYCGHFLGGIRIDPNFYNTLEEIDRTLDVVREHMRADRRTHPRPGS
jgi:selenocysteine lyase/cysteine desulfurase